MTKVKDSVTDALSYLAASKSAILSGEPWTPTMQEMYLAAAGTIDTLRAQLAEAQKNAERYDFLAGFGLPAHSPRWAHWRIERWTKDGWSPIYGDLMNAAIDAAKGDSNA